MLLEIISVALYIVVRYFTIELVFEPSINFKLMFKFKELGKLNSSTVLRRAQFQNLEFCLGKNS